MDEGFNTFMNAYDRYEVYDAEVNGGEMPEEDDSFNARTMARLMSRPNVQPLALPADQIRPEWLGMLAYYKTATAMQMLREVVLGPERFDPAFREYIQAWAFKSPQPADFFRCMENGTGAELAWFWRSWFIENVPLDQAIVDVNQSIASGLARITIANKEEMVMPVQLEIEFTNGEKLNHDLPVYVWYYTNLWTTDVAIGDRTIKRVIIDRKRVMPDLNRRNNNWVAPKPEKSDVEPTADEARKTDAADSESNDEDGDGGK
jgi:aminopeptidase N